jgi:hypothetical protein
MNVSVVLLLVAEGLSEAIVSLGELAALALAASFRGRRVEDLNGGHPDARRERAQAV